MRESGGASRLPIKSGDNNRAILATQALGRRLDIGVFFSDFEQLRAQLEHGPTMARLRENAWSRRKQFTFDHHADRLIEFFRRVIRTSR